MDEELPLKYARRYWKAVKEACLEAWTGEPSSREVEDALTGETRTVKIQYRIKDLVGVASLAKLGTNIITSDLESKEPKRLEELTAKLMDVTGRGMSRTRGCEAKRVSRQKDLYEVLHKWAYNDIEPAPVGEPRARACVTADRSRPVSLRRQLAIANWRLSFAPTLSPDAFVARRDRHSKGAIALSGRSR